MRVSFASFAVKPFWFRQSYGRAVFLYGFAKNERDNIDPDGLQSLLEIAAGWLAANTTKIAQAIEVEALQEIDYDQ